MRVVAYVQHPPLTKPTYCVRCETLFRGKPKDPCPACGLPLPPDPPRLTCYGRTCEELDDERILHGFLWFPRFISGERRWFCFASIRQRLIETGNPECVSGLRWADWYWDDADLASRRPPRDAWQDFNRQAGGGA